jgi:hypothetical protein
VVEEISAEEEEEEESVGVTGAQRSEMAKERCINAIATHTLNGRSRNTHSRTEPLGSSRRRFALRECRERGVLLGVRAVR